MKRKSRLGKYLVNHSECRGIVPEARHSRRRTSGKVRIRYTIKGDGK